MKDQPLLRSAMANGFRKGIAPVLWLALSASAWACTTPVYRYAMYNWPAAPYGLVYLHPGQADSADEPVHAAVRSAAEDPPANVTVAKVDVSEANRFERLPESVREAWEGRAQKDQPLHVLVNPDGAVLFSGRLKTSDVAELIASPARQQLGELLGKGQVVLLVFKGPNAEKNRAAQAVVEQVVADVESGKIAMPEAAADPASETAGAAGHRISVATLTIDRNDSDRDGGERWLARMLMGVEPGLDEFAQEAMVFPVYGRGRALPPCIGKGISAENLRDAILFMAGPCSCMIKDQNPGVDLLMRCDWEAASEQLAAMESESQPGPAEYREVTPGSAKKADADQRRRGELEAHTTADKPSPDSKLEAETASKRAAADASFQDRPLAVPEPTAEGSSLGHRASASTNGEGSFSVASQLKLYALAVTAAGVLVVALGGFWMWRRQVNR